MSASLPKTPALPGQCFPRTARLLRRSDFVRVQGKGRRVHTPHFVILLVPSATPRIGVTVGRRVGGATLRNRVKRLVREVFRLNRELFPSDCDIVLVARPGAERLDYATVKSEVERAQSALFRPSAATRTSKPHPDP
ncbi:MAG TPA: ribonuclease P protein component [Polyangiales bacterium]|nr:ribonuclease P protein component [Polyangiales bacterium]